MVLSRSRALFQHHLWCALAQQSTSFTVASDAKVSFSVSCKELTKFSVYTLASKTNKKGVTTYSLKKILSRKFKYVEYYNESTKKIKLKAGVTYYLSIESVKGQKGGDDDYRITVVSFDPLSGGKNADALAMPETTAGSGEGDILSSLGCVADDLLAGLPAPADTFAGMKTPNMLA